MPIPTIEPFIPIDRPRGVDANSSMDIFIKQFNNVINNDIKKLNEYIESFNNSTTDADRIANLRKLYKYRKFMIDSYSMNVTLYSDRYRQDIQENLWQQIKTESTNLGFKSITELLSDQPNNTTPDPSSLPELIANMSQQKIAELMNILWENTNVQKKIYQLYKNDDPEGENFRKFLGKKPILTVLEGGNTRNLKIELLDGSPPVVLKVDVRLGQPKTPENSLRDKGAPYLTQILAEERQATIKVNSQPFTARLVLTDFCPKGDLESQSIKVFKSDIERLDEAFDYFQQMAKIMLDMQTKKVAFPDAKNSNWLINAQGKLQIADTKSFLFVNDNGVARPYYDENFWIGRCTTPKFCPPGFLEVPLKADYIHTYTLGLNIEDFLTKYNLLSDICKTFEGKELAELIGDMNHPESTCKINLKGALDKLESLQINHIFRQIILTAIPKGVKINNNLSIDDLLKEKYIDTNMKNFINTKRSDLIATHDPVQREKKINDLNKLYKQLIPISEQVKSTVERLDSSFRINPYYAKNKQKAKDIDQAFRAIPVEDRVKLSYRQNSEPFTKFYDALSMHRREMKKNEIWQKGEEKMRAKAFHDFKKAVEKSPPTSEEEGTKLTPMSKSNRSE